MPHIVGPPVQRWVNPLSNHLPERFRQIEMPDTQLLEHRKNVSMVAKFIFSPLIMGLEDRVNNDRERAMILCKSSLELLQRRTDFIV